MADAQSGDIKAQSILGYLYETNLGVDTNYDKAMHWYLAAADQGDRYSQYKAAQLYRFSGHKSTAMSNFRKLVPHLPHPASFRFVPTAVTQVVMTYRSLFYQSSR